MIEEIINFAVAIGPARNQYARGTCLAFASSDFNRHTNIVDKPLSVDYLSHHAVKQIPGWKAGDGLRMSAILTALQQPGQPVEDAYIYDPNDHGKPLHPVPTNIGRLFTSAPTKCTLNPAEVVDAIKDGKAICLVLALSQEFMKPDAGIVAYATNYIPNALHAVLAVGVGAHSMTNENHILIRNSWGTAWGNKGHAWLPVQYLKTHLLDNFTL